MKQKLIHEIEEMAAEKSAAAFTTLPGMEEMKALIAMVARDTARNTTLALRNEGYIIEGKSPPSANPVIDKMIDMVDEVLSSKSDDKAFDKALSDLATVLFTSMSKRPNA